MTTVHALGAAAGAAALVAMLGAPAMAAVVVSIENPGVSNTSQTNFSELGVETFDNRATGENLSFTSDFGGTSSYTGDYTNVQVWDNGSWGGVDNTNYAVALGAGTSYTIQLNKSANYFGYYQLALSGGNNDLEFWNGNSLVAAFSYADILSHMTPGHLGSPYAGQTQNEYFGFLNFNFTDGDRYDRVVFSNTGSDGFESDNHTVGLLVPEPATWAMLIAGFGLVGLMSRRRRALEALS